MDNLRNSQIRDEKARKASINIAKTTTAILILVGAGTYATQARTQLKGMNENFKNDMKVESTLAAKENSEKGIAGFILKQAYKIPKTPQEYKPYLKDDYIKLYGTLTGKNIDDFAIDISTRTISSMNNYIKEKNNEEYKLYLKLDTLIKKAKLAKDFNEKENLKTDIKKIAKEIDNIEKYKFKAFCAKKAELENITLHIPNISKEDKKISEGNRAKYIKDYMRIEDLDLIRKGLNYLAEKLIEKVDIDREYNQISEEIDNTIKEYQKRYK